LCKNDNPISWNSFQTFQANNTYKVLVKEDFAIIQMLVHLYERVGKYIYNFNKIQCKWKEKHSIDIYNHQVNKLNQLICNIWNEKYVVSLMNEQ